MPTRATTTSQGKAAERQPARQRSPAPARPLHFDRYGLRRPTAPAVVMADGQGKLLQISEAFATLLQVDRESLQGCNVEALVLAEDWRELHRALTTLGEGLGNDAALTVRFITREQRARRCLTTIYALRRRDGSVESLLLALQPVGPAAGGILGRPVLMSAV